jgi:hypothetical protein
VSLLRECFILFMEILWSMINRRQRWRTRKTTNRKRINRHMLGDIRRVFKRKKPWFMKKKRN